MSATAVLLASGRGSNARALWQATARGDLPVRWLACLSDKPHAPVLEIARGAGVPTEACASTAALEARLREIKPDWVVLAGYMRILSRGLIEAFRDPEGMSHIVNIHPSRLPAFQGMHAYRQAFEAGVESTGVTVHLVEEAIDTGPIVLAEDIALEGCASVAELEARGLKVEHRLYPQALHQLIKGWRPR